MPEAIHLEASSVTRRFGKRIAVDGVSLRINRPLIVALVGPNGAGKTTLIRMILGLQAPSQGSITVAGNPPRVAYRKGGVRVGYMPQGDAIYPELTPRQNIAFFAKLHQVPRQHRQTLVDEALAVTAMTERADDRVQALSGGMRRRVSLACALVHRPQLVVLDEPTVGVDPELRARMWNSFHGLRAGGSVILLSTHYMAEAERADWVVFMDEGRIIGSDTPRRLMAASRTHSLEGAFLARLRRPAP